MKTDFLKSIIALFSGMLFGLGMMMSGMVRPLKVIAFLDVFGAFDPTLMFVLGGAILVFMPSYFWFIKSREKPILDERFSLATNTQLDSRLVLGAIIFGIGWGIAGICPGPAITLTFVALPIWVFIFMMFIGFWVANLVSNLCAK